MGLLRAASATLARRATWIFRYGRFSAAGLGLSCVVIGHASATYELDARTLVGLLVVGLAFHVVAFALNDLFDLEIDRTDPSRATNPLVAGQISPAVSAAVIAVVAVAGGLVDLFWFGFDNAFTTSGIEGTAVLAGAYALLVIYDAYSKRLGVPLLADTLQGAGWAFLVWYGAIRGGGAGTATVIMGIFVVGFVVIVNGVHGGLRDLGNDSRTGARTTAILLGAKLRETGSGVTVPRALAGVAWTIQGMLALLVLIAPVGLRFGTDWWVAGWVTWYAVALVTTAAAVVLLRTGLASADEPIRLKNIGAAHILALWIPLTALAALYGGGGHGLLALVVMAVPMLANASFLQAFAALPALAGELIARRSTGAAVGHHEEERV